MKQYKGQLKAETKRLIELNKNYVKNVLMAEKGLNAPKGETYTIDETVKKYNPGLTKDEIKAWVWYRKKKGIPMTSWKSYFVKETKEILNSWIEKEILFYDATVNDLVPFAIFTFGNIYDKIKALKRSQSKIIQTYGEAVLNNHLKVLEENKPTPLSIQNPIVSERPVILAISTLARDFMITDLKDDSVMVSNEGESLQSVFKSWLRELSSESFKKVSAWDIISAYIQQERKPQRVDKKEWDEIKKNARDEGEKLFKVFLHKALTYNDQVILDRLYNEKNNAIAKLNHRKVPIGVEISRMFGDNELDLREAQREGIAFMELVGSGIIAYDVGVGKTMTAIAEMCTAIKNGKCKRPLVVVPNPTYNNWISEMFGKNGKAGILSGTGITLNKWYNLGADYQDIDFEKKVKEGSITLITYEGLTKIGFGEETQRKHFEYLKKVITQENSTTKDRELEKNNEKIEEIIGVGLKDTIADIDDLGFDYICVDEAHNFKNVFSEVKSDEDGKQFYLKGGQPSTRGIKLFFLANYIQREFGRNVMLLTATPFTNSPLEIYSMLSLVAYEYMVQNNINNLKSFFEWFIHETSEYVVSSDGSIQQKTVVKSFNNRIALQKLINSHINFKTGEEANIKRPCKINIPKTTTQTENGVRRLPENDQILSYLELSADQALNQAEINAESSSGASKDDPGKLLRLMGQSLNNALSPFLMPGAEKPIDEIDFVENSPKILYAVKCIESVKKWHEKRNEPISGQVIYMNRGKDFFKLLKVYLEDQIGFKKGIKLEGRIKVDEVEILTGSTSKTKKENIKKGFNSGQIKVLIGTSTIREGINLQEKSTCLYNLYPDWNPTDIRQLEGRIWRQKNENAYVRIVMPLMENSMDVFVFQKLEEKTARINALWEKSDRGNVLDEDSLDPQEVKFALVTDINVLLDFELKKIRDDISRQKQILESKINDVKEFSYLKNSYERNRTNILNSIYNINLSSSYLFEHEGNQYYYRDVNILDIESLPKNKQQLIERYDKVEDMLQQVKQGNLEDKLLIRLKSAYNRLKDNYFYDYSLNDFKSDFSKYAKIKKSLFKARGLSEDVDISVVENDLKKELEVVDLEFENIKTEDFVEKLKAEIVEKKQKLAIKGGTLNDRVNEFASLNHLMSYKMKQVDVDACEIPVKELPPQTKNLELAKAKAIAIKIKLKLAKAKLAA